MNPDRFRVHPQQALAVYVESLAVGQRVVVFGDASLGVGAQVARLGARSVHVWDPDADRARREAARAPAGVVVRALPAMPGPEDLDLGDAFDLALVTDIELFDEPEALIARVRSLVGEEGAALVVAPNGHASGRSPAFDYYELFDMVAREFDEVTMVAQLPFFGVALAELGEEEDESPSVSVDTQLAGGERAPEAFIALASQRGVRLDPYAIVELPSLPTGTGRAAEEVTRRLEETLRDRASSIAALETALADRAREIERLSNEVDRGAASAEELRSAAERFPEVASRADRAERTVAALETELARVGDAHASEIVHYEEALRERAQAVRLLETELDRRERMIRELIDELAATDHATQPASDALEEDTSLTERDAAFENAELRRKLDALAVELARHEGERQARDWTIAELERRLETAPAAPQAADANRAADLQRRLAGALDELDVLRRALAQEHEARVRAESAECPKGAAAT
jgi:hypothetical protein